MDTSRTFGCTYRGLIIGTLGCIVVGAGFNYATYVLRVGAWSTWHYAIGANLGNCPRKCAELPMRILFLMGPMHLV